MSSNVKHQYAFDSEKEQFVDIEELEKKDSGRKFICLDCGIVLTPIMGEVRQRHFRHKVDIDLVCSGESQLHLSTKIAFYKLYKSTVKEELEFRIEYNVEKVCNRYKDDNLVHCPVGISVVKLDLTKDYPLIKMEKGVDRFIPDLLLTSKNDKEKIFIEIAYTHKVTTKKKESGYKIIEINIDREINIELFSNSVLSESHSIEFHNFQKVFEGNFCGGDCFDTQTNYSDNEVDYADTELQEDDLYTSVYPDYTDIQEGNSQSPVVGTFEKEEYEPLPLISCLPSYNFFIIYKDHTSKLISLTINEFTQQQPDISYSESIVFPHDFPSGMIQARNKLYKERLVESFKKGRKISSCFLCKHHRENYSDDPEKQIYCDLLHNYYDSNNAINCLSYSTEFLRIELARFNSIENDFKVNDLVRYIGGMIKYKGKVGRIIKVSNNCYKCNFNGRLTEWLTREEIQLIK